MGITSFNFLCFFAILLFLYYVLPGRMQWGLLLVCSVAYYLLSGNGILIVYPVVSVTVCYAGIRLLSASSGQEDKQDSIQGGGQDGRRRRMILIMTILVNIGILVVLKYVNFGIYTIDGIARLLGSSDELIKSVDILIPLGMSFYTISQNGYVV